MTAQTTEKTETQTTIKFRGVTLRRSEKRGAGPRGGTEVLYQSIDADPTWGYWYESATEAAEQSNASDRVVSR